MISLIPIKKNQKEKIKEYRFIIIKQQRVSPMTI